MEENIRLVAMRLLAMREIRGLSILDMAKKTNNSVEDYEKLERGEKDFSFSFLLAASDALGMDISELITGQESKLDFCAVTRQGNGLAMSRNEAYSYKHLAYNFRNRKAEPFIVTVIGDAPRGSRIENSHETQEFVYILEGSIELILGGISTILNKGDSAYFDSTKPHVFYTYNCDLAKFMTLVIK